MKEKLPNGSVGACTWQVLIVASLLETAINSSTNL